MTPENIVTNSIILLGTYLIDRDRNISWRHHYSISIHNIPIIIIRFLDTSERTKVM